MAWQVSKRVWDSIKTKGDSKQNVDASERLMLLALADKADENGICWPKHDTSYQTLGDMVGVNRRSAMRLIEGLAEAGHIWKSETVGRGHSNIFIVTIGLPEAEVKERLALIGVTCDTINNEEKVLPEAPISEPKKEMVLPVTQKGVTDDTNKGLNGVTGNTQSIMSPSLPSINNKGGKVESKSKKPKPPPAPIPEPIEAFRKVTNRYPNKATWGMITQTIRGSPEAISFWKEVIVTWIACDFNPRNVAGMLDCFKRGELPTTKKNRAHNGHSKQQEKPKTKEPGPISPEEWDRMLKST